MKKKQTKYIPLIIYSVAFLGCKDVKSQISDSGSGMSSGSPSASIRSTLDYEVLQKKLLTCIPTEYHITAKKSVSKSRRDIQNIIMGDYNNDGNTDLAAVVSVKDSIKIFTVLADKTGNCNKTGFSGNLPKSLLNSDFRILNTSHINGKNVETAIIINSKSNTYNIELILLYYQAKMEFCLIKSIYTHHKNSANPEGTIIVYDFFNGEYKFMSKSGSRKNMIKRDIADEPILLSKLNNSYIKTACK